MKRAIFVLVTIAAVGTLLSCGSDDTDDSASGVPERTLTVFAASSLTSTFTELADKFEASHNGLTVKLSFAGSSDLVAQLQEGAPADVFASADVANMDKAVNDDLVAGTPIGFASNTLEIAVPPDNPAAVQTFQDLAKPGVQVVVCAPEVPCGAAEQTVEKAAGVALKPVSEEASVTDVLNKVVTGEADAGVVYVTDVRAANGDVEGVPFAESGKAVNQYPIAALTSSSLAGLAEEFVALVAGETGQQVLTEAGFGQP